MSASSGVGAPRDPVAGGATGHAATSVPQPESSASQASRDSTPRQLLLRIRLPAVLPSLGSGLRLAAVYARIGAVVGEWHGASQGLGYLMLPANARAKTDLMFAALFVLALFTAVLHKLVGSLADHLARRAKGMA